MELGAMERCYPCWGCLFGQQGWSATRWRRADPLVLIELARCSARWPKGSTWR